MGRLLYFALPALLLGVACCTGNKQDEQGQPNAVQVISRAEQLPFTQSQHALDLLEGLSGVDLLDDALLLRWSMACGAAAYDGRKNERLSLPRLARAYAYSKENSASVEQARIGFYLGNAYLEYSNGGKAMNLYLEALNLADLGGDDKLAGDICNTIGGLYRVESMYEQAQEKYEKAVRYYRQANNSLGQVRSLGNIAISLSSAGSYQPALEYAKQANLLAASTGDRFSMGIAASVLARMYRNLGNYTLAETYSLRGIQLDTVNTAPHYVSLARLYVMQGKFPQAIKVLRKAEKANSMNRYTPSSIINLRAQVAEAEGRHVAAAAYKKRYKFMRDSLASPIQANQLMALEANNRTLQDGNITFRQENAGLKQQRLYLLLLGGFLLGGGLLLLLALCFRRRMLRLRSQKTTREQLNGLQKRLLRYGEREFEGQVRHLCFMHSGRKDVQYNRGNAVTYAQPIIDALYAQPRGTDPKRMALLLREALVKAGDASAEEVVDRYLALENAQRELATKQQNSQPDKQGEGEQGEH